MDSYIRMLATDLTLVLSQLVYTLSCIGKMTAGDHIINDMLPEQVWRITG